AHRPPYLAPLVEPIGPVGILLALDIVTGTLAQPLDAAAGILHGLADLDLDAVEAALDIVRKLTVGSGIVHPVHGGRIDGHFLAPDATQQFVDGQAGRLAENVPQRDVDPGDRLDQHAARAAGEGAAHGEPMGADVARILPDEARLQRGLDQLRVGFWREARERFAHAGNTGIRADLDNDN